MLEIDDVAEVIATSVRDATGPLLARIEQLERAAERISVTNALVDRDGNLILTLSDGGTRSLGGVIGKDGSPGENGRDGLSASDVDINVLDDGRTLEFSLTQGDTIHAFEIAFPFPIYQGVFEEERTYVPGDMVTWGGSMWHCDDPKGLKPGAPESGWTLAVKVGRPGKDAGK